MAVKTRKQTYYVITVHGVKKHLHREGKKKWTIKTYSPTPKTAMRVSKAVWLNKSTTAILHQERLTGTANPDKFVA